MHRKGRCSNNPEKCTNAQLGVLLPFAGLGSLCPECGAPLALVSDGIDNDANEKMPQSHLQNSQEYYDSEPSQVIELAKIVLFIIGIGLLVFLGLKYFSMKSHDTNNIISEKMIQSEDGNWQVTPINPSSIGTITANTEVFSAPKSTSEPIANLAIGTIVDVTGTANIDGVEWSRIVLPNRNTASGFVQSIFLASLNQGQNIDENSENSETPIVTESNLTPPHEESETSEISEAVMYIKSQTANIRSGAGVNNAPIGNLNRGDNVVASATKTVDGKLWYRVAINNGAIGWVSASLLSQTKPDDSLDANEVAPVKVPVPVANDISVQNNNDDVVKNDTPKATEGQMVVVKSSEANIRNAASLSPDNIIAQATKGMVLKVEDTQYIDGATWYKVKSNRFKIDGWISSSAVNSVE